MPTGISPGGRPIDESVLGTGKNWVTKRGGLPPYIRGVARGINPADPEAAIDEAVAAIKRWAATSKTPAVRAAAAAALARWEAMKVSAAHDLTREAVGLIVDLAAANGHHVPGTAYHWKHDYIPLDRETALANGKRALAKRLFGEGAAHRIHEPGARGVLDLHPAKKHIAPIEPSKPAAPKAPRAPADPNKKALAAFTKAQKAKYAGRFNSRFALHSRYSDEELVHAASLGDEKAAAHIQARALTSPSDVGTSSAAFFETARAKSIMAADKRTAEREARQAALDEAKRKAESPDAQRAIAEHAEEANARAKASGRLLSGPSGWSVEDIEKAISLGDTRAIPYLTQAKKRAAKQAAADKKTAALSARRSAQNAEGDAVSKALDLSELPKSGPVREGVEHAMAMIDKVHSDGRLVPIPVKNSSARGFHGVYNPNGGGSIGSSKNGTHHALTLAHEAGHWLDNTVLGDDEKRQMSRSTVVDGAFTRETRDMVGHASSRYASKTSDEPEWSALRNALDSSAPVQKLKAALNQPGASRTSIRYYLSPEELWARAYAQYIAEKSGSPVMAAQLKEFSDARNPDTVHTSPTPYSQWTTEEFAPISKAIDAILAAKGWLK